MAQPYGLPNANASYQEALQGLYADQIGDIHSLAKFALPSADQSALTINMVQICQINDNSLLPILEGNSRVELEGSTKTTTKTITDLILSSITPSKGFFSEIFMISNYSAAHYGETNS